MRTLHRALVDHDMAMLRALAACRGIALSAKRQAEAAEQLARALLDPLAVRVALAHLSPEGRRALDALLAAGAQMPTSRFTRRFGAVRPFGPGRMEREVPWANPANAMEELWYAGFIFRAFTVSGDTPSDVIFVPQDLLPLLPAPQSGSSDFPIETVASPALPVRSPVSLVEELFTYLIYIQTRDVRPYADGRLGRRDLAALNAQLASSEPRRLALLRRLARRLDLVQREGEFLHLATGPAKRWLTAAPARQLTTLWEAWRDDPGWDDLCLVASLDCDQEANWRPPNDPVATRRAFLELLARVPPGEWWLLDSFVAAVKGRNPDFQRPDGDYDSWYIRDAGTGDYLSGFGSWDQVEGALLADLLTCTLDWLGVVETAILQGPRDGERQVICRLAETGAAWLGLTPSVPEAPPPPPIIVRPDFSVEIPPPSNLYARFQLERFAERQSVAPCTYRLTVDQLGRALARGIQVEQVLAFLQQASSHPVPANVAGQLRLWAGRFGQVELEEVALLRVRHERVLKELSALPETRSLIANVLSSTTAIVRKADLPRLRRELRARGYLLPEDFAGESPKRG